MKKPPVWAIALISVVGSVMACTTLFCAGSLAIAAINPPHYTATAPMATPASTATALPLVLDISFSTHSSVGNGRADLEPPLTNEFHGQTLFVYRVLFSTPIDDRSISFGIKDSTEKVLFAWSDPSFSDTNGKTSYLIGVRIDIALILPAVNANYLFVVLQDGAPIASKGFIYGP
jgi:hypothetical protein